MPAAGGADGGEVPRYWIVLAPLLLIGLLAAVLSPTRVERSPLVGTWEAKGVVVSDSDPRTYQPPGTRFTRRWVFTERCAGRDCRLTLAREASARTETAPVRLAAGRLHAVFRVSRPGCRRARPAPSRATSTSMPRPGGRRLSATETSRTVFPGCGPDGADAVSSSSVRWTAVRR